MKQVVQNYKTGELKVEEVPPPSVSSNGLLVKTKASLISAGTERTRVETAQMNIVEKAFSRLDLVKITLNNVKQEGLLFTIKKAFNKLDAPISLGYSCAGEVIEVGEGVKEYRVGDKVACAGEGFGAHSEINLVPEDCAVAIPGGVEYEEASFVALGAIALNAVWLAQTVTGESVAVIGLGLIGQIAVQILKERGFRVLGIEIDEDKLSLAKKFGLDAGANPLVDDVETIANNFSAGKGLDAVIITAASRNNLPIEMAGEISRNKGRVILVGAMPIIIPRKDYYQKELYFVISRGCGSGLFYSPHEDRHYPYNYKPKSIKENMQDFLSLLSHEKIDTKTLTTHRFNLEDAKSAYELIRSKKGKYLGIIFKYDGHPLKERKIFLRGQTIRMDNVEERSDHVGIGFIGAGSFAQGYLLPVLKKIKKVNLIGVSTAKGINAKNVARKFGFGYCATDYNEILNDEKINCVFIVTRHNLHAKFVIEALRKGKNVFVEKPLCINEEELRKIISIYRSLKTDYRIPVLMVGFNRRFSPFIQKAKKFFEHRAGPLIINYRVNAGNLAPGHWVHNPEEGGGRIIGEICHFVDLLQYLTESAPIELFATCLNHSDKSIPAEDNVLITLKFADGSIGTISYSSVGDIAYPRERIEIFGENSVAIVDNFKRGVFTRSGITQKMHSFSRDMGHRDEMRRFISSLLDGGPKMIPFKEIILTTLTTFKILESLRETSPVKIDTKGWMSSE